MRNWLFHPLIFYPLAIVLAALLIAASVQPQKWPREPAPVAAQVVEGALVYAGAAFDSPAPAPQQEMFVTRDFWGAAQSLRIAIKPEQGELGPQEQGVRILLAPADAERLANRQVDVEVRYSPSPVNAATGLAISLQGANPAVWISQELPPEPGTLRFTLPAQTGVNAIGLRALSTDNDQNYAVEITSLRVVAR